MIDKEIWWGIIRAYGENIFPLQIITVITAAIIVWLLIKWPGNRTNIIIKTYFSSCFTLIGVVFFLMHGGIFPGIQEYMQAGLFITMAVLFGADIFSKKMDFKLPENRWHKIVMFLLLSAVFVYPLVGILAGHYFPGMIIVGTHPCPTAAFALVLLAAALPGTNKILYVLLLIWSIPFPIIIQIPKFGVYEDSIMLACGIFALIMLVTTGNKKKKKRDPAMSKINREIKDLVVNQKEAVFATISKEGVPNIVPIHSKHVISSRTILISDQFMNKTRTNLLENPRASLTLWNESSGYQIKGTCKYRTSGFFYRKAVKGVATYAKKKNIKLSCKGIVLLRIKEVTRIPAGLV